MDLSVKHYKAACRAYEANYAALDKVLYDLCRRYPDQQDYQAMRKKQQKVSVKLIDEFLLALAVAG
jgi:hypothetical protein